MEAGRNGSKKKVDTESLESVGWPAWRGSRRDGVADWLPDSLPDQAEFLWEVQLPSEGLGGLSASDGLAVVSCRDFSDSHDVFRCLDLETGLLLWQITYAARGALDYGNSPRATPLFHGEHVYLLGAMGHLHCVNLETGEIVWKRELAREFGARVPTWGFCQSPLIVNDKLIVQPGSQAASIAALSPLTGEVIWQTPGRQGAYSSFVVATFSGVRQVIGYDKESLGGWDIETGERLWELIPPESDDFNVPTPIQLGSRLFVTTENNGSRLYEFDSQGQIKPEPVAHFEDLAPDTHSPVAVGDRIFGVWSQLYCLDASNQLKPCWVAEEDAFLDYATVIGSKEHLLIITLMGEMVLVSTRKDRYQVVDRLKLIDDGTEFHSHPAIVGRRMVIRIGTKIACIQLAPDADQSNQ